MKKSSIKLEKTEDARNGVFIFHGVDDLGVLTGLVMLTDAMLPFHLAWLYSFPAKESG